MDDLAHLKRLIRDANHVLVLGHASPDGDCVGAMLALALALEKRGKSCALFVPDPIPERLAFLPGGGKIVVSPDILPDSDLAILPDCSDLGRLGPLFEANRSLLSALPLVNIDHHVSNSRFGTVNLVEPAAAATCEQLTFLLPSLDMPIDKAIATCLLAGIVADTQNFRTPNTTSRSLRATTILMEAGAPLSAIADDLYHKRPLATLRLWGLALSKLREGGGVIWTDIDEAMLREAGAAWSDSEPLINLLASVRSAEVALLFKVVPDGPLRVSLRSNGATDVSAIAAQFGGGGHRGAAGCSIDARLQEAEQLVIARVREALAATAAHVERA